MAKRLLSLMIVALLAAGARAETILRACLNVAPVTTQNTGQAEEEERSESKTKTAAAERRPSSHPAAVRRTLIRPQAPESSPALRGRLVRVLPLRESDLRNGLGAPLLC
jgi:hypothetical protein